MWIEILNKSKNESNRINKNSVLGFVVIEPEYLRFKYEMKKTKKKKRKKYYQNCGTLGRKRKRQWGGFLSRYNFAYAGRDSVNQLAKVAPGVIKQAGNNIDHMVKNRLNQAISVGGGEIDRVLPKILRGAIEDLYKTPFRLLGNFRK